MRRGSLFDRFAKRTARYAGHPFAFTGAAFVRRGGDADRARRVIRAVEGAHNGLLDIEELTEKELSGFREQHLELANAARDEMRTDVQETGSPKIEFPGNGRRE